MSYEQPTYEELAQETLLRMMRDFSEDFWCAGWLRDLEFTLWDVVIGGSRNFGLSEIEERDVARMRFLHERCGGWWTLFKGEEFERFVTTEEWLRIVSERAATQEESA
jgi:hypothetical protein